MKGLRKVIIGVVALAALALGGAALAGATSSPEQEDPASAASVPAAARAAALEATGGGTLGEAERDGEQGATYEVEVTRTDGAHVDVRLADDFSVVAIDPDQADGPGEQGDGEDAGDR
jgi:uncharacterized membrane protein